MRSILAAVLGSCLVTTGAVAQDRLDFTVGGLKWRCQYDCNTIVTEPFVKVDQVGSAVTFTDAKGNKVAGTANTTVRAPEPSKGPSLRCQMNPSYCGKEPPPKTTYSRSIEIPEWSCSISVQEKNGEPDTAPPFKAKWLRFASPGCAMGRSIWTTLSANEVKVMEKRCGEWNLNC